MTRKTILSALLIIIACIFSELHAQRFTEILNETLTINSRSAINGYTRNKTKIRLPEKTKGFIYRITIAEKGDLTIPNTLISLLQSVAPKQIAFGIALTHYAVSNNDNNSIDAFIFTSVYDADNFYDKKDNEWSACHTLQNVSNTCRAVNDCLSREVYFGFRNGNLMQGLDVKLEVVAIVDDGQKNKYNNTFCIVNNTKNNIDYLLSSDNKKWAAQRYHKTGYRTFYTYPSDYIFVKLYTPPATFKTFTLYCDQRYCIDWDDKLKLWNVHSY